MIVHVTPRVRVRARAAAASSELAWRLHPDPDWSPDVRALWQVIQSAHDTYQQLADLAYAEPAYDPLALHAYQVWQYLEQRAALLLGAGPSGEGQA
jgi:hypothetical protein